MLFKFCFRLTLVVVVSLVFMHDRAFSQCAGGAAYTFTGSTVRCEGRAITFTNNDTSTIFSDYVWSWGDGSANDTLLNKNPFNHVFSAAGTYQVKLYRTINSCVDSSTQTVTVSAFPAANFTFGPDSACSLVPVSFTNTSTPGTGLNYSWNFGNPTSSANTSTSANPTHIFDTIGYGFAPYTVKLKVTNSNFCADSITRTVRVRRVPDPVLNDSDFFAFPEFGNCQGAPSSTNPNFRLTVVNNTAGHSSITGYKIHWGDGDSSVFSSSFSGASHTYTALGTFSLRFTVLDSFGCETSKTYTVANQSNPAVGVAALGSTQGCAPKTVPFLITNYQSNPPGTFYVWDFGDSTAPVIWFQDSITNDTIFHEYTAASCGYPGNQFVVRLTAYNQCDSTPVQVGNVRIWTRPDPVFSFQVQRGCTGTPINITNATLPGRYGNSCNTSTTYVWSMPGSTNPGPTAPATTSVPPILTYLNPGAYTVTLYTSNPCGLDSFQNIINVDTVPVAQFTSASPTTNNCINKTLNFTNTSTGGNFTYAWAVFPATGWNYISPSSDTSFHTSVQFTAAGTYTVRLIITNQCSSDTAIQVVNIIRPPDISMSNIGNGCAPFVINPTLTIDSGFTNMTGYSWSFAGGSPSTSAMRNPGQVTYASSGTYVVIAYATNICGTDSVIDSFVVNVNPVAAFGTADNCFGGVTNFTDSSTVASGSIVSYSWDFGDGGSSTAQHPSRAYAAAGTYVVKLVVTSDNGCQDSISKNITVHPKPVANFTFVNACNGVPIAFTDSSVISSGSIIGYDWDFGDSSTDTIQNPGRNYAAAGNYNVRLIIESNNGCLDTVTKTVSSHPKPAASYSATPGCKQSPVTYTSTSTIATGSITTYLWDFGDGGPGSGSQNPVKTFADTGVYQVKLVVTSNNGCKDSVTHSINVYQDPVANYTFTNACNGFANNFSDSSYIVTGSISSYSWDFSDGSGSTSVNPGRTFTNPGTYPVKLVVTSNNGCRDSITKSVTVYPRPATDYTFGATAFCAPQVLTVTNTTPGSPAIQGYTWKILGNTSVGLSNATATNPVFTFADNQTGTDSVYNIRLIATTTDGCIDSVTKAITIYTRPIAGFSIGDSSCGPFNAAVSNSASFANSYQWSSNPAVNITNAGAANAVFNFPVNVTTTDVTYTSNQLVLTINGCRDSISRSTVIHPRPLSSFSMSNTDSCGPLTVAFTNASDPFNGQSINSLNFAWNFGSGITSLQKDSSVQFTNTGVIDSVYPVQLTVVSIYGCSDDTVRNVTVHPNARAQFNATSTVSCAPFVITSSNLVNTTFPGADSIYQWYADNVPIGTGSTFPGYTITNTNDSVTIKLVTTSKFGCKSDSTSLKFHTIQNPVPGFDRSDTAGCHPFAVTFTNTSTPAGLGYTWQFGNGQTSTATNPVATFTNTGNSDSLYSVKLIIQAGTGCKDSISKNITVKPLPNPSLTKNVGVICWPDSFIVTSTSINTPPITSLQWKLIDGTTTGIDNPTGNSTVIRIPDNQTGGDVYHRFRLHAVSDFGCIDSVEDLIVMRTRPIPDFTLVPDTACGAEVISTINSTSYGNTYAWSSQAGVNFSNAAATQPNITFPVNATSGDITYSVRLIATTIHGCKDTISRDMLIRPRPAAAFTVDSLTGCGPLLVNFTNQSTGNTALSYSWNFGDGSAISTATNPNHTFPASAFQDSLFTVKLVTTNAYGCKDSTTLIITVKPGPTARMTASDTLICTSPVTPGSITFNNTSFGIVDSFFWDFGDGSTLATTDDSSVTHFYPNEGIYTVKLRAANECTFSVDSITVTALESPQPSFTKSDSVECGPISISFTNTTPSIQTTYSWNFGNGVTSSLANPAAVTFNPANTGFDTVYLITMTAINFCDTTVITDSVRIRPLPISIFAAQSTTGCSPFNARLTNLTLGVDTNAGKQFNYYVWNYGDGSAPDTVFNKTLKTHIYSTGATDTFTVKLYAYNECGVDSSDLDIIVYPNTVFPFVNISPANGRGCVPLTVTFTNNTTGANSYLWNFDSINTSNNKNEVWTFTAPGTYNVSMTASNGCSDTSVFIPIEVFPLPVPDFTFPSLPYCVPSAVSFTNTSSGASSYLWRFGDGTTSIGTNPSHLYSSSGTFNVRLIASFVNAFGVQCSDSITRPVLINSNPVSVISADTTQGCSVLGVNFSGSSSVNAVSYTWDFGNGSQSASMIPTTQNFNAGVGDTTYTVRLVVTNAAGCTDTSYQNIFVSKTPVAGFTLSSDFGCHGYAPVITNTSSVNVSGFLWVFGDGTQTTAANPNTHNYILPGDYFLKLVVNNTFGCKDSITDTVTAGGVVNLSVTAPDTVECAYNNLSFSNPVTAAVSVMWYFGDGAIDSGNTVSHFYTAGGTYQLKMVITSADGCKDSAVRTIVVYPRPVVGFSINDSGQCINGNAFSFTNSSGISSGSMTYLWDLGTADTSTQVNTSKVFLLPGTYNIFLKATSDLGCSDSITQQVNVHPKPVLNFSINDSDQCLNTNAFSFTNASTISTGIMNHFWDFGDGSTADSANPVKTYANHGTYEVELRVTSGNGCMDSISKSVLVFPKPVMSFAINDSGQCVNTNGFQFTNTATLASGTMQHSWTFGDGDTSTQTSPSHVYAASGTYPVKLVSITDNLCTDSIVRQVIVFPKPTVDYSVNDSTQCVNGNSFVFANNSTITSGSINYEWSFGNGAVSTQADPVYTYPASGIYDVKLKVISDNLCTDSLIKPMEVFPKPAVKFNVDDNAQCLNGNIFTFTDSSFITSGLLSYSWDFGNGDTSTLKDPVYIYDTAGTYQVKLKVTSGESCVDSFIRNVMVFPKPLVSFSIDDTAQCLRGNRFEVFNTSTVPAGSIAEAKWNFGDWSGQGLDSIYYVPGGLNYAYGIHGIHDISLRITSGHGCRDSIVRFIEVYPDPAAGFTVNDSDQCANTNVFNFTNTTTIGYGGVNYTWDFGDGDTSTLQHPTKTYTLQGPITVDLKAVSLSGCRDSVRHNIMVYPKPMVAFTINDSTQCLNGNSFSFNNQTTISVGTLTYNWDFGDGNTSTAQHPTHVYLVPGTYSVKLKVISNVACTDSLSRIVIVHPKPAVNFTMNDSGQCVNGNNFIFTNNSSIVTGTNTYEWTFGDGGTSTLDNPLHTYNTLGTYNIKLVATSDFGCKDSISYQSIIHPKPGAAFSVSDTDNCGNLLVNFTDQSAQAVGWFWTFGDPGSGTNTSNAQHPSHFYAQQGDYVVTMIAVSVNGCFDTAYEDIHVYPVPVANFTMAHEATCDLPVKVNFTNTSTGGNQYYWTFDNTKSSSLFSPFTTYDALGYYTTRLVVFTDKGCTDTISDVFHVAPQPHAAFDISPQTGCQPLIVDFTNKSTQSTSWFWDFGDGDTTSKFEPTHTYLNPGSYNVTLYARNGRNCADTLVKGTVDVYLKPIASILASPNYAVGGTTYGGYSFVSNSSADATKFYWDFGNGKTSRRSDTLFRYDFPGEYKVNLIVENDNGCTDTTETFVNVDFFGGLFVPNAFMPAAGYPGTDKFKPVGTGLRAYRLQIYSTWGELLWETTQLDNTRPAEGWDGTFKGEPCKQDVYVWKIEGAFMDGTVWKGKLYPDGKYKTVGTVTLIR
jgi:PKD repeat protein